MIKLERSAPPVKLTPELVVELTVKHISTESSVWNIDWLKAELLLLSNGKCAYCECNVTIESNYMEVEHYECKDKYKDKVVLWSNLLPSCKRCNGAKHKHDVNIEPIINPFTIDPKNHLKLHNFRLKGKTSLGTKTIEVLRLNDVKRLSQVRFNVGTALQELIESTLDNLEEYKKTPSTRIRNKLQSRVEGMLQESQPKAHYSATCATVLCTSQEFEDLRLGMIDAGIWKAEYETSYDNSKNLSLE